MPENARDSTHLDEAEKAKAEQHAPLRPLVIHEIVRAEGDAELSRPASSLLWSGLAAGLSMGFSFVAQALLQTRLGGVAGGDVVAAGGYAVGFAIVILGRQQLFTESTLTAVVPALHDRKIETWMATFRLWAIVLAANLVGTWLFAAMLAYGDPLPDGTSVALVRLAGETVADGFGETVLRAMLAGWLIALMVWLLPSARTAKIVLIVLLTWLVALAKLSHIIAGSTEAAYGVLTGHVGLGAYFGAFLVPTFLGNTVGGAALVAMLNHAPVAADGDID